MLSQGMEAWGTFRIRLNIVVVSEETLVRNESHLQKASLTGKKDAVFVIFGGSLSAP